MKAVNRASFIMKVTGIVLILLSLVLGLYALLNTGKGYEAMNQEMSRYSLSASGIIEKIRFDDGYLSALSAAADGSRSEEERMNGARPKLRHWFGAIEKSAAEGELAEQKKTIRWLNEDFDSAAFRERLDTMEDLLENQKTREYLEYINSLSAPPKKG